MPDIQLRFHHDMLVFSSPLDATLAGMGIDEQDDRDSLVASEPETILEVMRVQASTGVQCLVTPTNAITRSRLAHLRLDKQQAELAHAATSVLKRLKPQHLIAEIGPTGLPLDPTSKTSMQANRDQYTDAACAFDEQALDAFFVNGMTSTDDLLCALMGIRKVSDLPLFASIAVDAKGRLRSGKLEEAVEIMNEYEADVVGIRTSAPLDSAAALVDRACRETELPILVQLDVGEGGWDAQANPYADPDALIEVGMRLRGTGAQFLQASGLSTARHSGALVAATMGLDTIR